MSGIPPSAEGDPQLQAQRRTMESRWSSWGVSYEAAAYYYGGEVARLLDQQGTAEETKVFENMDLIPGALFPGHSDRRAIIDRQAFAKRLPDAAKALLLPHVETDGSLISLLKDNSEKYPAQDPMHFYVSGDRQPREATDFMAEKVDGRYPQAMEELSSDKGTIDAIQKAIKLMKQGRSILGITYHAKDIIDTAIALKIDLDLFEEQGHIPEKTTLGLSKAIAWGEYEVPNLGPVVMIDVVRTLADRTYLLLPRTESAKEVVEGTLPQSEVDRNNRQAAEDNNRLLAEGNTLALWSPIGSTRGGRVNKGAAKMMSHPNTYVMPLSLWRLGEELKVRCLEPVKLNDEKDADSLMVDFAKDLSELVPDQTFTYP